MEMLQKEWKRLQETAPAQPKGPPTEEEHQNLVNHKAQVNFFLSSLSPEQRLFFQPPKRVAKIGRKEARSAKDGSPPAEEPTVYVVIALNSSRKSQKIAQVKARAELSNLWSAAKKKLNAKGTKNCAEGSGTIYLARTQVPISDGDLLENNDVVLFSLEESEDFGKRAFDQKPALPEGVPDFLLVLDFEATCNNGPAPSPQEIIEFPTLLFNVKTGEVEKEFHYYIRPDVHPILSEFCTELTGIKQWTVDTKGISLQRALDLHIQWLHVANIVPLTPTNDLKAGTEEDQEETHVPPSTYLYLTCGDWDLATCLPRQLKYHGQSVQHEGFFRWINVKKEFCFKYGTKAGGMTSMLQYFGLELEGRHHSGIDDCRNIARICQQMLREGWRPTATSSVFPKYLD